MHAPKSHVVERIDGDGGVGAPFVRARAIAQIGAGNCRLRQRRQRGLCRRGSVEVVRRIAVKGPLAAMPANSPARAGEAAPGRATLATIAMFPWPDIAQDGIQNSRGRVAVESKRVPHLLSEGVPDSVPISYQREASRSPCDKSAGVKPVDSTEILCAVQRRPLCILADSSPSSTSPNATVDPRAKTPPVGKSAIGTVIAYCETVGTPPGIDTRATLS